MISKTLHDLPFSQNQLLKSAGDFEKQINKIKKKQDRTLSLSHGTCSFSCLCINAVAVSVMLYLQHDFYNIVFKIKHKLYIASGLPPPPPAKHSGCAPADDHNK
jgi:hypothetical protein